MPSGVSVHTTRVPTERAGTPAALREMEAASLAAAAEVAKGEPGVVVWGCTSSSFYEGPAGNERVKRELSAIVKAPAVTAAGAMADCLKANGIRRVNVVTPYVAATNERLRQFLAACGIEVVQLATFDMLDMFDHAKIQPDEIYRKVKEITTPKSEAVFVACTQLRALEVLDQLERDLGKPVYSAVQASAWQAYEAMGVDPHIMDCGSLLRKLSEPGAQKKAGKKLRSI